MLFTVYYIVCPMHLALDTLYYALHTTYNVLYTDERDRTQGRVNLLSIKMMLTEKLALGACRTSDPPSPAGTLKT